MQYRLLLNLGTSDAKTCNDKLGASLSVHPKDLTAGAVIELPETAAEWLSKKYPALMEPVKSIRSEARKPEITAPAK